MGFWNKFLKQKAKDVSNGLTAAAVKWDPNSATEAEIEEMDDQLKKISKQYAEAKVDYEKEQKEADLIKVNYNRYLQAAQNLQALIDKGEDVEKNTATLNKILTQLEEMKPEVQREVDEAKEAKEFMDELLASVEMYGEKLKSARKALTQAKRNMEKSELQAKRAKEREEQLKENEGIKKSGNGLDIVLRTMNEQAEKSKAETEASKIRQQLLKTPKLEDDADIAAALGATNTSSQSSSDRLASLAL